MPTKPATTVRKPKRVQLCPEIVEPALKYYIREGSQAAVKFSNPVVFNVPLVESPHCLGQRTHELAHLRYTPRKPGPADIAVQHGVTEHWLQVCEDARVNILATKAGATIDWLTDPVALPRFIQAAVESKDLPVLVALAMARTGCAGESKAIAAIYEESAIGKAALQLVHTARAWLRAGYGISDSIKAARFIESALGAIEDATKQLRDALASKPADGLPDYDSDPTDRMFESSAMEGALSGLLTPEEALNSPSYFKRWGGRRCEGWGKLTIVEPPRPIPCNVETKGYRKVCSDTGLVPNAMHRWCSDRYVFGTTAMRDDGGSLLIDMSGSMHLSYETITRYLSRVPLATVGVYSGCGKEGDLIVLSKNGTRVAACPSPYGGNIVDGPALRWLSRQGKPRTWISDGQSTGIGDALYGQAECSMLCAAYGIKRISTFGQFLKSVGIALD